MESNGASGKILRKINQKMTSGIILRAILTVTALSFYISGIAGSMIPAYGQEIPAKADDAPIIISENHIQSEKAAPEIKEATYYLLVSEATGMVMTVEGYSDGNSVGICQMADGHYASQVWTMEEVETGYYRIVNYYSGKALNVPNRSTDEGKQIIQWNKETSDNSKWKLTALSDASYRITSKHIENAGLGYSLQVKEPDKKGSVIVQAAYGDGSNDGWKLQEISAEDIKENPGLETPRPREAIDAFIREYTYVDGNGVAQLRNCGGFWAEAETIEMLIDAYEQLGDEKYKELMVSQVDGFLKQHGTNWNNPYNDDIMWATIMCARTYLLTGDEKYLDCAEVNFAKAYNRGWSDDMGGGLWWKVPEASDTKAPSKNACVNGPGAIAACLLGEATGEEAYFQKAKAIIDWQATHLYVAEGSALTEQYKVGRVFDSIREGVVDNDWASTYNQGTFIGACTMLYQHYGQQKYFDYADAAANYAATELGSGTEKYLNCEQNSADLIGFKGILARWLSYFAVNCNVDTYNDWMYRNAASAWTNRNSENLMWTQFGKITQENLAESTEPLDGGLGTETVGEFSGWGCSTAVAWLMDCTDIDAKQVKKQKQSETPAVTAGKIALQKVVEESRSFYEAGQRNCPLYIWKEFTDAYEDATNLSANVTAGELKAIQEALEKAATGMTNFSGNVIEAENGILSSGTTQVTASQCSGGKYVGNIGDGNNKTAAFKVQAGRSGEYVLSIYYCTWGDRSLNVLVNGSAYPIVCKGAGSWNVPADEPAQVTIPLNKGENTIVFAGVGSEPAPNVDCFKYEKIVTSEDAALDQAEKNLDAALTSVEALYEAGQGNYTDESYEKFKEAYEAAEAALYGREDVSAARLKSLQDTLAAAKNNLRQKTANSGNTEEGGTGGSGGTSSSGGENTESDGTSPENEDSSGKKENTSKPTKEEEKIASKLGVSAETAKKINDVAEKYNVPDTTLFVTDKSIKNLKNDNDIKGSSFARIQARATKQTRNSVTLKWNKVKGADGYMIYAAKCGKKNSYKLIKTIKGSKKVTYTQKKLKKGTFYKYIVRAYKIVDGKKVTLAVSKTIHTVTGGGKYGVAKSVKVKSTKVTLKKGKTYKLAGKQVKADKKIKNHRKLKYESSNTKIATVSGSGKIKAKKKGTCYIYAYAQNGVYKRVKVTVK